MIYRSVPIVVAFLALSAVWIFAQSPPSDGDVPRTKRPTGADTPSAKSPATSAAPDVPPANKSAKAVAASNGDANLIRNGGFESPRTSSPWQDIGPGGGDFVWNVQKNANSSGRVELKTAWRGVSQRHEEHDQSVDIDFEATLSQDFETTAGRKYTLAFAYAHNPDGGNSSASGTVRVVDKLDGKKLHEARLTHSEPASFDLSRSFGRQHDGMPAGSDTNDMNFRRYESSFTAVGPNTRLEFESHQPAIFGFVVDDVSVRAQTAASDGLPDATAGGKYRHLLRTIHAPADAESYGRFKDWGHYTGTTYRDEKDLPAGYWVYAEPYWYIWKTQTTEPATETTSSKKALKRRATVTFVNGDTLKGDIVEEHASNIVLSTRLKAKREQLRIEREKIQSIDWLPSVRTDESSDSWLTEIPANIKLDPATSPMCVSWDGGWLVHRFDIDANRWETYMSPDSPIPGTSGHAVEFAIGTRGVAILDRTKACSGWLLDFVERKWKEIPKSPLEIEVHIGGRRATAFLGSRIVTWGATEHPQGAVYDIDKQAWTTIADAPIVGRYRAETTAIGEKMFVWYGYGPLTPPPYSRFGPISDGAIYDSATNAWEKIAEPPLEIAGYGLPCVEWDGRMEVVGGAGKNVAHIGGAIYDPIAKTWETIARSPGVLGEHAACAIVRNRSLFVWSGQSKSPPSQEGGIYEFRTRRWKTIKSSPVEPRVLAFAHAVGSKVVVWGGWSPSTERFVPTGAIYDVDRDAWDAIPDLPTSVPKTLHPGW
jgi:hypothetical protein